MSDLEIHFSRKQETLTIFMMLGVYLSCFTMIDQLTTIFCGRFPLIYYIIIGLFGYRAGRKSILKQKQGYEYSQTKIWLATFVVSMGLLSAMMLSFNHPSSHSKCAWRNCHRITGFGLFVSPFPVPAPSCSLLHLCINEATFSVSEGAYIRKLIKEDEGCYEP